MALFIVISAAVALGLSGSFLLIPGSFATFQTVVLFCAGLAATWVMTRWVNKKPLSAVGLALHEKTFKDIGAGCLLGFLMMTGIFLVEAGMGYATPTFPEHSLGESTGIAGGSLLWFALGAMGEEVFFRGYLFQTLIQTVTFLPALLLMAGVFAFAHVFNPHVSALPMVNIGCAGVLFSVAYMKTRSLWLPFGIHLAWNFSQTTIYGFPTSGLDPTSCSLVRLTQSGPTWIVGGGFGPEGGLLATLALILGGWYVLKAPYLRAPEGIVTLDSIEDLIAKKGVPS
jgi:hypothetical protein